MPTTLRCPECDGLLKLANPPALGKKVKCPKCAAVFAASEHEANGKAPATAVQAKSGRPSPAAVPKRPARPPEPKEAIRARPPAPPSRDLVEDDPSDEDEAPRKVRNRRARADVDVDEDFNPDKRPRSGRSRKQQSNKGLLIGLCAGAAVLLLLVGGGLIWWLSSSPGVQPVAQGQGNNPPPDGPGNPPPVKPLPQLPKNGGPVDLPKNLEEKTAQATAWVRVTLGNKAATGSGFIVKTAGDTAYLITNHHVIDLDDEAPQQQPDPGFKGKGGFKGPKGGGPGFFPKGPKGPFGGPFGQPTQQPKAKARVSVVLNSGTPAEQELQADVVAVDEEADLAALRVTGARNLPPALDVTQEAAVAETLPVFTFGFPASKIPPKGSPTVTIGKGSIAGIRRDAHNEIVDMHINGDLLPGNSGGPVIDAQGRLVGIAVAAVLGKQIGFIIPANDLSQMFKGRLFAGLVFQLKQQGGRLDVTGETWSHDRQCNIRGRKAISVQLPAEGKLADMPPDEYQVYARLSDPMLKIASAAVHFAQTEEMPAKAAGQAWPKVPNSQQVSLKIQDQNAYASFQLPRGALADQTYAFQFSYVNADGQTIFTQPHFVRLTFPKNPQSLTLTISGLPNEPTRRYFEDTVPKQVEGKVSVKERKANALVLEIDPVPDPKAWLAKVAFGKVVSVQGRTVEVEANKVQLPLPDPVAVSQALVDMKSPDARMRATGADVLGKCYAPLADRRVEVSKALEAQAVDKDIWAAKAALRGLLVWGGPENVAGVAPAIDNGFTHGEAVAFIIHAKDPSNAAVLAKLLAHLGDRAAASAALKSLGVGAQQAVIPYVSHKDVFTAKEACYILKEIGTADCVAALTEVANANNPFVSPAAREALAAVQARK